MDIKKYNTEKLTVVLVQVDRTSIARLDDNHIGKVR